MISQSFLTRLNYIVVGKIKQFHVPSQRLFSFIQDTFLFLIKTTIESIERNKGRIINQENSGIDGEGVEVFELFELLE